MEQTFIEDNRPEAPENSLKAKLPRVNPVVSFFLNRRNQLTIFVWVFALSVPILSYYFLFHRQLPVTEVLKTCSVNSTFRVPCGNLNLTSSDARANCVNLFCCFDDTNRECFHSLPSAYFYTNENVASVKNTTFSTLMAPQMFLGYQLDNNALRVTLSPNEGDLNNLPDSIFEIKAHDERMDIEVFDKETDNLLLTTGLGPLMVTENYLEWTFYIGEHLFGLDQLYMKGNETVRKVIYYNGDDHTTLPVFMAYQNGSFRSLLVEYDGPMEFIVLPSKLIVLRALGETTLSFILHSGPTPKDITKFYYSFYNYEVPEKWVLKPHICRDAQLTYTETIEDYIKFIAGNPVKYATDCFDKNLYFMLLTMKQLRPDLLSDALKNLNGNSKFIMTVFPHIPTNSILYKPALKTQLYTNVNTTEPQNGTYSNLEVVYPNYDDDNIINFLTDFEELLNTWQIFDVTAGYSFSNNWASDGSGIKIEQMEGRVYFHENITTALSGTLLWNATIDEKQHIYDHNNYGRKHVNAMGLFTQTPGELFLSSIFSPNTISQVENLNGTWVNLKRTLSIVMSHSIFAHPLISVPICGSTHHFNLEDQVELCTRWYIMAATMPMFLISSEPPMRDPMSLPSKTATNIALKAVKIREMLSLYYYTLLTMREPIVRPTFFEFYENITTFSLDEQYMIGDGLLVAQPVLKDSFLQRIYLPTEALTFYEFFGGEKYEGENLGWISLNAVPNDWFMFIRGGRIIPLLEDSSYTLAIALIKTTSTKEIEDVTSRADEIRASGFLNIDLNTRLNFDATEKAVTISNILEAQSVLCDNPNSDSPTSVSSISLYGLPGQEGIVRLQKQKNLCDALPEDSITIDFGI